MKGDDLERRCDMINRELRALMAMEGNLTLNFLCISMSICVGVMYR